jgi:putative zinc finger protein
MMNPRETTHERFEADLAELAAGVLDGREEAALLDHLGSCPNCATEFEQLASAAKSLLLLVLEIEPPVGFEGRFWDRIESCSSDTGVVETVALRPSRTPHLYVRDNPGHGDRDDAA